MYAVNVRFAWGWATATVVLATVPTALALLVPPPGLTGFGTIMFVNDFAQYEAAMHESARSASWLVYDPFTPEPHHPALMFPLYVLIGKLGAALGTGWEPIYRLVELGARGTLAAVLAAFALRFADPRYRRLGIALALTGGGIAFWAVLAQAAVGVARPYGGNGSYELNTYALFLGTPHAVLGLAATVAAIWLLVELPARVKARRAALLAGCVIAVGFLHPFNLVSLGLAAAVLLAIENLTSARWRSPAKPSAPLVAPWPLVAAAVVAVAAAPFVAYNAVTFTRDPFWSRTYGSQNRLPSPTPLELTVDLGAQALGLVGILFAWRRGGALRNLAIIAATLFVASYAPVPFQRRLGFGLAPLLAVLTTVALGWWADRRPATGNRQQGERPHPRPLPEGEGAVSVAEGEGVSLQRSRMMPLAVCLVAVASLSTPLVAYGGMLVSVRTNGPIAAYRATPELKGARDWLAANTGPADVVLASWDVANYLGGGIPAATVGGHPVATAEVARRRAQAGSLFLDPAHQERAIQAEGPTYLVSSGAHEPVFTPNARTVYATGEVRVVDLRGTAGVVR